MSDKWEESGERLKQAWILFGRACEKAINNFRRMVSTPGFEVVIAYQRYPNSKIVHLAQYGKNRRIRKKNHDKIMRWYKEVKKNASK